MDEGRLLGIARRERRRGPMEVLSQVDVTCEFGVAGDCRGVAQPGRSNRRQIALLDVQSWQDALTMLGHEVPWQERRANLLVGGIRLPHRAGVIIAIGATLRIETTCECDPCQRMDEIVPGLRAALTPFWRGGVLGRVLADGDIAVGDTVRIEQ